jgi:ADP-ribosylglycohydrolase
VKLYTSFTKPHEVPVMTCYIYCYAIKLIHDGKGQKHEIYYNALKEVTRIAKVKSCSTIKYWMENCIDSDDLEDMPIPHNRPISYIKNSFILAFYNLKHCYSYEDAIKDILLKGGDTSMNAAIVGGLIGALHGKNSLPKHHLKVLIKSIEKVDSKAPH